MDAHTRPWAELTALANRQAGHVAVWQARALGISRAALLRRVRDEGWTAPHRGVVRLPGAPDDLRRRLWTALLAVADLSIAQRCLRGATTGAELARASALAIADSAAVSGWSAAELLGHSQPRTAQVQLVVPERTVCRRRGVRLIRSRRGIAGAWTWVGGLPVATPPRMLWDIAQVSVGIRGASTHLADLAVVLDRTRTFAIPELLLLTEDPSTFDLPLQRPTLLVAAAREVRPGFSHSKAEADARSIIMSVCAEMGLTAMSRPHPVRAEDGRIIGEVDVAVPALRFGAEIDGPHHDEPSVARHDRARDGRLADIDWIICRYRVEDIEADPERFRQRVRRDLQAAINLRLRQAA